jgi:hypothetical protein
LVKPVFEMFDKGIGWVSRGLLFRQLFNKVENKMVVATD